MRLVCTIFGLIFVTFGVLFAQGKGHIHLRSWKALSQEEKQTINIEPLCKNIGHMIGASGIIFLLRGLCPAFSAQGFVFFMVCWIICCALDVRHISKSKRYRKS